MNDLIKIADVDFRLECDLCGQTWCGKTKGYVKGSTLHIDRNNATEIKCPNCGGTEFTINGYIRAEVPVLEGEMT